MPRADRHTVLIDGECVLCDGFAVFVARHDPHGAFVFETQQSPAGQQLLDLHNLPNDLNTIVLIERSGKAERAHVKSSAVLRIARRLSFPIWLAAGFLVVPSFARDWCYDVVAGNRYRLFGRKETCGLPDKVIRERLTRKLEE
ncbi:unnamed protein product [Ostreobium quekettii]|uniref:Thiol-disulfide oxidoreductase DCC n=1 Tax=Ostreobium quekettii TaxID=121088 RepID=A0A8S1J214_9CHLO|nr:unnamed protein product [Ostreobium quekettii]|eukprot:evm.model.scf_1019.3 EVM.evm.TU.scf_1019.3   scf_1019:41012-41440(+)